MGVALVIELEGMNESMYVELCERVELHNDPPEGLIFHGVGPSPGGWRIVDVWDTEERWDEYFAETVKPALDEIAREHGYDAVERSQVTRWDIEGYTFGPGPLVNSAGM